MTEFKTVGDILQQHYPLPTQLGNKRWVLAQRAHCKVLHATDNFSIETAYMRVIHFVKANCLTPGETYFERDYRQDRTEGLTGMHSIITANFYWRLDCAFTYNHEVTYAFNNCVYEADIRQLIRAYPLDRTATLKALQPSFNAFYNSVLVVQEPAFIHSFTR